MAANNSLEVIYGDTDSIMVHSNTNDLSAARKMAEMLKKDVNKHYRCMEIDIDGVMASMLLLKKKKCVLECRAFSSLLTHTHAFVCLLTPSSHAFRSAGTRP